MSLAQEDPEEGLGDRWSWVFWLLLVAAAAPLTLSAVAILRACSDDDLIVGYSGLRGPDILFADRWQMALSFTQPGWSAALTALALLVLTGAVAGGRPTWLVVTGQRRVIGVLAAACALWAAGTAAVTVWFLRSDPTERALAMAANGSRRSTWVDWTSEASLVLLAVVVSAAAAALCLSTRSGRGRQRSSGDEDGDDGAGVRVGGRDDGGSGEEADR